jgi:hypothetical protein
VAFGARGVRPLRTTDTPTRTKFLQFPKARHHGQAASVQHRNLNALSLSGCQTPLQPMATYTSFAVQVARRWFPAREAPGITCYSDHFATSRDTRSTGEFPVFTFRVIPGWYSADMCVIPRFIPVRYSGGYLSKWTRLYSLMALGAIWSHRNSIPACFYSVWHEASRLQNRNILAFKFGQMAVSKWRFPVPRAARGSCVSCLASAVLQR